MKGDQDLLDIERARLALLDNRQFDILSKVWIDEMRKRGDTWEAVHCLQYGVPHPQVVEVAEPEQPLILVRNINNRRLKDENRRGDSSIRGTTR